MSLHEGGKSDATGRNQPGRRNVPVPRVAVGDALATMPYREMSAPRDEGGGMDPMALVRSLRRRWATALGLGLLLAVVAAGASYLVLAGNYTVYAQLHVAAFTEPIAFSTAEARNDFGMYLRTQAARIKSRYVLNAALKRDEVRNLPVVTSHPDPITWLEEDLQIVFDNSEIVKVQMQGKEPEQLQVVVNAVVQAYLKEVVTVERNQNSAKVAELEDVYRMARDKLRLKRDALKQRAEEAGTTESQVLTQKQQTLLATYGEIRRQHSQVRFELMRAYGRVANHQSKAKGLDTAPVPDAVVEAEINADPMVVSHKQRMVQVQDAINRFIESGGRRDDSVLVTLRVRLETAEKQMKERQALLREEVADRIRDRAKGEYEVVLGQLKDEAGPLIEQEKALASELDTLSKEVAKIGVRSAELDLLRQEILTEEEMVRRIDQKLQAMLIEVRRPPRVTHMQDAIVQRRDSKKQLMATAASPVAALFLACFGVAWWENRSRRVSSAHEVIKDLGMRIVGTVPSLPGPVQNRLLDPDEEHHEFGQGMMESIDSIRTVLLRDASVEATRTIMVTSATPGEGKTALAAHLAVSLARAGRRTLLIDCDLRAPAAHILFEQTLEPGFSEVLVGETDLVEVIRPTTAVDGLWLIPAGRCDREVIESLARDGLQEIFDRIKDEFDFVVVDAHPVLAATDALLVGQHVDAVLLSLQRDISQVPRVHAARQQLNSMGIRVMGAVVNGLRPDEVYTNTYQYPARMAG